MQYLTGYTIKPYENTILGEVIFTDGTNNGIRANQQQCEAYGYTYNRADGTCNSSKFNINLDRAVRNENNKNNGPQNVTGLGSNTVQINGSNNTTRGFNNNCFINGSANEIANGVDNATVLGVGGKGSSNGEFTIGGGLNIKGVVEADRKVSIVNLSGMTTDNTATNLTVNGLGGTNYINVNENSIVGFEIYITRLEVGGSASTLGNYSYKNIKGVVRVGETSGMAFIVGYTRNIGKIGVNGTTVMVDSTTGGIDSISIQVTDRTNVTNVWSATVTLHELTSNITF